MTKAQTKLTTFFNKGKAAGVKNELNKHVKASDVVSTADRYPGYKLAMKTLTGENPPAVKPNRTAVCPDVANLSDLFANASNKVCDALQAPQCDATNLFSLFSPKI